MTRRQLTALLPPEVSEDVEALRRTWDPASASRIPAHVTVAHELTDAQHERLPLLRSLRPLTIHVGGVRCWGRPEDGAYLNVVDAVGSLGSIRHVLGVVENEGVVYQPHVTLTHPRTTRSPKAAWNAIRLLNLEFAVTVEALSVIESDGTRWFVAEELPLMGRAPE